MLPRSIELVPGHWDPAASTGIYGHYVRGVLVAINVRVAVRPCLIMNQGSKHVADDEVEPASSREMDRDTLRGGVVQNELGIDHLVDLVRGLLSCETRLENRARALCLYRRREQQCQNGK